MIRYLTSEPDLCAPVLLQQLLRSMESSEICRSAATIYAVLSLLVRLIACQSSVFNVWFSRRCYERSRGEMITMLYEKTLSRKIVSTAPQQQEVGEPDGTNDGGPPTEKQRLRYQLAYIWEGLRGTIGVIRKQFGTTNERSDESKKSASMGKILNMMRHASLAILLFVPLLTARPVTTSTK